MKGRRYKATLTDYLPHPNSKLLKMAWFRGNELINERPGTDYVISRSLRGLKIKYMGRGHKKSQPLRLYDGPGPRAESGKRRYVAHLITFKQEKENNTSRSH